ncbi:heat shock protein 30-like [Hypomesus transpacificus]|uniref:heat shock protein 30-like n=1 Tax=Hypomesus transpacificus TaxID=137520 RepID=UPI001F072C6F|nr:heat shock protein 30-like [Hypomesus transpacificus]
MLRLKVLQSSLRPAMDLYWPVRCLWPELRPILLQQDLLQRHMKELDSSLEMMEKLQHTIFQEMDPSPAAASAAIQPVSYQLKREGGRFALTLDTKDFSPEDLCVKQVGRKLRVSGKTEKKQDDGKGSYSYRCQEFRQEFDLPDGVNPEQVTCLLAQDGKLHIQAPKAECPEEAERVVPISSSLEQTQSPQCLSSPTGGSTDSHQKETADKLD